MLGQIVLILGYQAKEPHANALAALHKADGMAILLLTVVRLGWRLGHRPPALPPGTPGWQALAAGVSQTLFYILLLVFPLTGWLSLSMFGYGVDMFGLFQWPALPFRAGRSTALAVMDIHRFAAKLLYLLLALHVAGALKHHFINRDGVLRAMLPARPQKAGAANHATLGPPAAP